MIAISRDCLSRWAGITDAGYNKREVEPIVPNRLASGPVNLLGTTHSTLHDYATCGVVLGAVLPAVGP